MNRKQLKAVSINSDGVWGSMFICSGASSFLFIQEVRVRLRVCASQNRGQFWQFVWRARQRPH